MVQKWSFLLRPGCTRGWYLLLCTPPPYPALYCPVLYLPTPPCTPCTTRVHTAHPWSDIAAPAGTSGGARSRSNTLGSETSLSLGEVTLREEAGQSCHPSSEVLDREQKTRRSKNRIRLDRTGSERAIYALRADWCGGSLIPDIPGPEEQNHPESRLSSLLSTLLFPMPPCDGFAARNPTERPVPRVNK